MTYEEEQREEHERELDQRAMDHVHDAIAYSERENHNLLKAVERLEKQNAKLEDALIDLLDGLDSNYDERCGLTNDQWQERIKDARQVLTGGE